ncbi:MAG TPA: hypothetical protein DEB30_01315 [Candidatus Peribacter riflensis]|uniref:50S ribosomal protein L29 n=1 Tax=Candidatus Peribacter riflensis TaxID=1735162 RepID=A0A0S1SGY0_9BACT|nr:MAG: hypothetical protein PeribacterA2_0014 [Candidatus Peribacter riflensis]OGJ78127.1 MAG: hypothetical protein A2398_01850 [Candidatus Peribacteria bacterium RIFOXYB1_FULL_57_12]OGJ82223.1 MAG: hypothetical protein A2412_02040 [Candidatus Peribacteria bacterium RIFOXYC1_FULL_58_8]ALM10514.1 MAG: hypothetical protein PeribacterB2_0014 [Candidatus Peribacter riflensis]ALM11617.1 MAG: hypothetical protein PeribacterC2_0014 [Candidatus Peribacter riflensis]
MTKTTTAGELRAMQLPDLSREIKAQVLLIEQLRLGVQLKKEKDTAKLRRERRQLARMKTEWARKTTAQLQGVTKPSTVPTSAKASASALRATADKTADRSASQARS